MRRRRNRKISELGESALVKRILGALKRRAGKPAIAAGLVVPNGDDAAVIKTETRRRKTSYCTVVSTDMLVESVHFDTSLMTFGDIGARAMTANISDMAAMGGASGLYCVVSLAIPVDISVENVDKLLEGMSRAARKDGVLLIGGDTVRSPKDIVISVTIFGSIEERSVLRRDGARVGDLICATGTFGDAAAGLEVLLRERKKRRPRASAVGFCNPADIYGQLVHAYRRPRHRLCEATAFSGASARPTAMMDSSDGLAACVRSIASASGLGARVRLDDVPLSASFLKWAGDEARSDFSSGGFPWKTVLEGGEEYELVFSVSPSSAPALLRKADFTVIGEMTEGPAVDYLLGGRKMKGDRRGYENF